MGGDEIVTEWLGDMYSTHVLPTATPQRFSATSKRFRTVIISNKDTSNNAYIGEYYSNATDFAWEAMLIYPKTIEHFEYIDIYNLGFKVGSGAPYLQLIAINQY